MDDIIVTGNSVNGIEDLIRSLNEVFTLKDLSDLTFFLGIQVTRNKDTILLFQATYIQDLLTKTGISNCKGIESLFNTSEKLKRDEGAKFHNPTLYKSVIGSLQYTVSTTPELALLINKLSQFMSDPRQLQ